MNETITRPPARINGKRNPDYLRWYRTQYPEKYKVLRARWHEKQKQKEYKQGLRVEKEHVKCVSCKNVFRKDQCLLNGFLYVSRFRIICSECRA